MFLNFLFCLFLFASPSFTCSPPFPVFSALCQTDLGGPGGPASRTLSCPHLRAQTRIWETPLAALGPGLRAVGEIPVFNQHKPQCRAPRGAAGCIQISGRMPAASLFLRRCPGQRLPSCGTPRGTRRPADSALVLLGSARPGVGGPAPPPQGQQSNNVQGQAGGAFGSCVVGGLGIPRVDGAQSTPGGTRKAPGMGTASLPCLPQPPKLLS